MTAIEKLDKAKKYIIMNNTFFASIMLKLETRLDTSCPTAMVNNKEIVFNPHFIEGLTTKELIGLVAHEVLHVALLHPFRRKGRDFGLWNLACDYAINPLLLDSGFHLPKDGLVDSRFRNMNSEEIFAVLKRERESMAESESEQKQEQEQEQSEEQSEQGQSEEQSEQGQEKSEQGQEQGEEQGEAAVGSGWGDVGDAVNQNGETATGEDMKVLEQSQSIDNSAAALQAEMAGELAGELLRGFKQQFKSETNWRQLLAEWVTRFSNEEQSWERPNKRYAHAGLFLPSNEKSGIGEVVIAVDNSASIDYDQLSKFIDEINALFEQVNPEKITVIPCDTRVGDVQEFYSYPIAPEIRGGGGTRFKPVFEYIEQEAINPEFLIYFTDLEAYIGKEFQPNYPVLWLVDSWYKNIEQPAFGDMIQII